MKGAFSEENIDKAISRLPTQSSAAIRSQRARAEDRGLGRLAQACDAELQSRPFEYTGEQALDFEAMADQVRAMDLADAIRHAFTRAQPPDEQEVRILRWISSNPGGSHKDLLSYFGNRGLSLYIGHLVYHRYGCFRKFMEDDKTQSSVLLIVDRSQGGVRYTLRPEAEAVFREIGVLA